MKRAAFLLEPTSRRRSLVTGALVGAFVMLAIFGWRFTLGLSPYWDYPRGDGKLYVMGYQHFVQEPWAWPPGVIQRVSPPEGLSLTYTDSIPLLALPAKLVAPLVPRALRLTFERPYGLWLLLVFTLQGLMAARADRRFGFGSVASAALSAAFVCTLPAFLVRFGHEALDSHFFLLWALLLAVAARGEPPGRRQVAEWSALFLLVTLTHPYLLAMCAGLWAAWCATALVAHRAERRWVLASVAGTLVAVPAALALVGLLHARTMHGKAVGFGLASFNPLSLVVGQHGALSSVVDGRHADATGFQYEGQDYLGLGLLAVIAAALIARRRELVAAMTRHRVLLALLLGFVVFALSNRVFFGRTLLFEYPWPGFLEPLATQFRSSGRFVWVPTYALALWSIAQLARRGARGALLLAGALALQLGDVRGYASWMSTYTSTPDTRRLDAPVWSELLDAHERLTTYPHYDCVSFLRQETDVVSYGELYELSFLASRKDRIVSSLFSPRGFKVCPDEPAEREAIIPRDDTLYVLFRRVASGRALVGLERRGARCLAFDGGYACGTKLAPELGPRLAPPPSRLGWVSFRDGTDSIPYQGPGWGLVDLAGTWAGNPLEGRRTSFHYVLGGPPRSYVLELELGGGNLRAAEVSVSMNDRPVGGFEILPHTERRRIRLCVPPDLPALERWLVVDLEPRDPGAAAITELHVYAARLDAEDCSPNPPDSTMK